MLAVIGVYLFIGVIVFSLVFKMMIDDASGLKGACVAGVLWGLGWPLLALLVLWPGERD